MTDPPAHWQRVVLGDLINRVEAGTSFAGESRRAESHEWGIIKVSAMTYGRFRENENKAVPPGTHFSPAAEIRPGDLLISRANTQDYVGASVLVRDCRPRLLLSDKSLRLHPGNGVDRRWLWYALSAPRSRRYLSTASTGVKAGMRNISQDSLFDLPLFLPPMAEQVQIVDVLEDHLSRLDAATSYLSIGSRRINTMQAGVLQASMSGTLSDVHGTTHSRELQLMERSLLCPTGMKRGRPDPLPAAISPNGWPAHWVRTSLEEATHPVRTISYGILKPGPNIEDGIPYVRVINMRDDLLAIDDLHRTTPEIAGHYERSRLAKDDVLVSIRGTYGRVVVVPDVLVGANITQDTARLAFVGPIDPEFASTYLRSPHAQNYMKRVARGVAVKGVNIADLRVMPFPIPPLAEQRQIVLRVAELTSQVRAARETILAAGSRAESLRRTLLDAASVGRLAGHSANIDLVEEMAGV